MPHVLSVSFTSVTAALGRGEWCYPWAFHGFCAQAKRDIPSVAECGSVRQPDAKPTPGISRRASCYEAA